MSALDGVAGRAFSYGVGIGGAHWRRGDAGWRGGVELGSRAVMEQKIDELTRRVDKHNCLIERTYLLERDVALLKNDAEDIERKVDLHG